LNSQGVIEMVWKIPQKNHAKRACDKALGTASFTRALDQRGIVSTNLTCNSPMTIKAQEVVDVNQMEAERKRAMGIIYARQAAYR